MPFSLDRPIGLAFCLRENVLPRHNNTIINNNNNNNDNNNDNDNNDNS